MSFEKVDSQLANENNDAQLLPEPFLDQLSRIRKHREQANLFIADIDLQRKRFDVEKGLFGRIATSFSGLSWWKKGLIGVGLGALAASLGLVFSLFWAIALPFITLTVYSTMSYVFDDYTQSEENRFTQLTKSLAQREEEMQKTILELQAAENALYEMIEKLNEFRQASASAIDRYETQVQLLKEEVKRYENAVLQFEQLKAAFKAHTQGMQAIGSGFSDGLNQIEGQINQQFERMRKNTDAVEQATQKLNENIASLKEDTLLLTGEGDQVTSNPLAKLIKGFNFRSEEDLQVDQEKDLKAEALFESTDAFIVEMEAFLREHHVKADAPEPTQASGNKMLLN
ncbi:MULTISPECIES: hypothetical protein [Legionella]|uniref:Inclusion membrane protein A n=1 Tax=Legionella maceachernii TaxID=466 RepID=A0A0W0VX86_9GAMM|nr:hypothetical protein [Legionella maceachernii]KTD24589.1 hypothetical protein Lmac_2676 [Legionella maceachernii]SJZ63429.1 hypothetical protein SAMN02745128_00667 [Legionella maceachernii]SUP01045.1 Uncharacterised protein [Legionella maceachernii]